MQSGKYRFVGTECLIGDTVYDRLGQYAEFTSQLAKEVILGGGKFLPEEDFNAFFTEQDCRAYPTANGYPEPPQDVKDKRKRALQAIDELHSLLEDEQRQAS